MRRRQQSLPDGQTQEDEQAKPKKRGVTSTQTVSGVGNAVLVETKRNHKSAAGPSKKRRKTPNSNREPKMQKEISGFWRLMSWKIGGHALGALIFVYACHKFLDCVREIPTAHLVPLLSWTGILFITGYAGVKANKKKNV